MKTSLKKITLLTLTALAAVACNSKGFVANTEDQEVAANPNLKANTTLSPVRIINGYEVQQSFSQASETQTLSNGYVVQGVFHE